jgi:3-oxoacyl-[acyl-carrier protein] reductase
MSQELEGRTALVTGAGIGIGKAIALELARGGADVALTWHTHDAEPVARAIREAGRKSEAFQLDARNSAAVGEVVERTSEALGGHVDILVNNAGGLVGRRPVSSMSDEHWHTVVELNLSSAFYFTRAVLRRMPDGGRIINVASLAAESGGGSGSVAYAAAKAGMIGLTRGLAKEVGSRRITVNAVAPGLILDTPFHEQFTPPEGQAATIAATPLQRAGYPADVAGAVLYLASDAASFVTGAVLDVNGGAYCT